MDTITPTIDLAMEKQSQYLKEILKQLFDYAHMDFKNKIEIKKDKGIDKLLPSVALGVNILGEELEYKIKELRQAHDELLTANQKLLLSNKELRAANSKLTTLNHDKEVLLQEVHHRVKNNLQIILGLVSMQYLRAEAENAKGELKDVQSRIFSISLVHEFLYKADNFTVNVADYCRKLSDSISNLYDTIKEVELQLDLAESIFLPIEKATTFGLMLNEILSNCYKHYGKEGDKGLIWISLNNNNGISTLEVKNSICYPTKEQKPKSSNSLGNKLIKNLAKQMKAEVKTSINEEYIVSILFS